MHSAQARERWVILVDGPPVLPCFSQGVSLRLVIEQVSNLADERAERIGTCVREEGEEGVDQLRCSEATTAVGRDMGPESCHFSLIIAQ